MDPKQQPATSQDDLFNTLNDQIDAQRALVERFHLDLQALSRQVSSCDKLVRMAHISLNQIDGRIAEAVRIEAGAAVQLEASGRAAAQAATEAAAVAVSGLVAEIQTASREAERVCQALHRARGQTGLWLSAYVATTLLLCAGAAWLAYTLHPATPIPDAVAAYAEQGQRYEALLRKASDKEIKLIKEIQSRRAKPK